jgi:hypothetical protein
MRRPITTDDRVAAEWWTTMIDPDEDGIILSGCLLLRFARDGRCPDLWEYQQVQLGAGKAGPPTEHGAASLPLAFLHRHSGASRGRLRAPGTLIILMPWSDA